MFLDAVQHQESSELQAHNLISFETARDLILRSNCEVLPFYQYIQHKVKKWGCTWEYNIENESRLQKRMPATSSISVETHLTRANLNNLLSRVRAPTCFELNKIGKFLNEWIINTIK